MVPAFLSTALDIVVLLGLLGTAIYAGLLHRSLSALRTDRGELAQLTADLNLAVNRAESAIQGMRDTAREVGGDFDASRAAAAHTIDELKLIVDAGDRLASRIERATGGVGAAIERRAIEAADAAMDPPPRIVREKRKAAPANASSDKAESPILSLLNSARQAAEDELAAQPKKAPGLPTGRWGFSAAIGDDKPVAPVQSAAEPPARRRSKAEQQLHDAMQALAARSQELGKAS